MAADRRAKRATLGPSALAPLGDRWPRSCSCSWRASASRPPPSGPSPSCPRSLPSVSALERFDASEGTKIYDDNDELHHRVPRRAPHLRAPRPDPQGAARRDHRHRGRALLLPLGRRSDGHRARGLPELPARAHRRGRQHHHPAARQGALPHARQEPRAQAEGGGPRAGAGAPLLEGPHPRDVPQPDLLRPRRLRRRGGRPHVLRQVGDRAQRCASRRCWPACPRRPSTYSPFEHPDAAKRRRAIVLAPHGGRRRCSRTPRPRRRPTARARPHPARAPPHHRSVLPRVRPAARSRPQYGADLVFKGGLHVYTTLSPTMQLKAEQVAARGPQGARVAPGRRGQGRDRAGAERPEGALLTVDPQTGYIKAMVGGYDFFKSEFNRAVQARRQPGSAFKPFVYIAALESGLTPATRGRRLAGRVSPAARTASRGSRRTTTASSAARSRCSRRSRSRSTW